MSATKIRKELKQEIKAKKWDEMLLKDASIYHIVKHVYVKYSVWIWFILACLGWGLGLSGKLS